MATVQASRFSRNFGEYQDIAQREIVEVSSHGRLVGAFISPVELRRYRELLARERQVYTAGSIPADVLEMIANAEYPEDAPDIDHLMKD